jgi:hypothetical protein
MNDVLPAFAPASAMHDADLRRELVETHRLTEALSDGVGPDIRTALQRRCEELDAAYLERFPGARSTWPWPTPTPA